MKNRILFVDVDDTLVRTVGQKRIPMPAVISRVRELSKTEVEMYLWSSGGADYARSAAIELGIEDCFVGFLPKPEIYLDDQPVHEWRFCKHILPNNAADI
jgi:FMN phosphatase YigB (HAD superfamily)